MPPPRGGVDPGQSPMSSTWTSSPTRIRDVEPRHQERHAPVVVPRGGSGGVEASGRIVCRRTRRGSAYRGRLNGGSRHRCRVACGAHPPRRRATERAARVRKRATGTGCTPDADGGGKKLPRRRRDRRGHPGILHIGGGRRRPVVTYSLNTHEFTPGRRRWASGGVNRYVPAIPRGRRRTRGSTGGVPPSPRRVPAARMRPRRRPITPVPPRRQRRHHSPDACGETGDGRRLEHSAERDLHLQQPWTALPCSACPSRLPSWSSTTSAPCATPSALTTEPREQHSARIQRRRRSSERRRLRECRLYF